MLTWQEIIERFHIKYYNSIAKATKSLCNNFNITCVDYLKIYTDGKFIYLTNRPDCAEYYASEKLFSTDPYFRHPNSHQSGLILLETNSLGSFKDHVITISDKFNIYSPVVLTEKGSNYVEIFCFSGEKPQALQALYVQHSRLLKLFGEYFKKELNLILKSMEEESLSLIHLQGDYFYSGLAQPPIISTESLYTFLIELGKKEEIKKAASLSPRERECLHLLIQGNSAKDMAFKLHLSPRTIEHRLEHIKIKLNCSNKHELFSTASDLEKLGLLERQDK